jgi:hypothetical protein
MRVKFAVLGLVLAVGVLCAGCTSGTSRTPAAVGSSQAPAESVQPSPTVETAWFWADSDKEAPLFRLVAFIGNPGPRTLSGVQLEWVAYDASNSIVGSYKSAVSDIPPGAKIPYVAGAGLVGLSGVPARADLRVVDKGGFVDTAAPAFKVADVNLKKSDFTMYKPSKGAYDVTAKVTTGLEEVASAKIGGLVVLKDQAGAVVGGDFWMPENLPETLPPGTTFAMKISQVVVTAKPASAEVFATQEP